MTAISSKTRAEIKGYLEGFIKGLIDEYKGRKILKPTSAEEYLSRLNLKKLLPNIRIWNVLNALKLSKITWYHRKFRESG